MLIEWHYEALVAVLPRAPAAVQGEEEALARATRERFLRDLAVGRVRLFACEGGEFSLVVYPAEDWPSLPVPTLLQHDGQSASPQGDPPGRFIVVMYPGGEAGRCGANVIRYLYMVWEAAQRLGTFAEPGREGEPAILHEVWARDLRDCLEQIFDGSGPGESPI